MKKILILLVEEPKQKDLDFYHRIKKYLDERGQGEVFIARLGWGNLKRKEEKYFATEKDLLPFLKKEKIEILANNSLLEKKQLEQLKEYVAIIGIFSSDKKNEYDFNIPLNNYSEEALMESALKLSIVDKLNWDSNFFGINIASLNHALINENIMKLVFSFCKQQRIQCLYFRADSRSLKNVELAEKYGFHFANIRTTYILEKKEKIKKRKKGYIFRESRKSDIPWIIDVSRDAYTDSRYYFDSNFPREICSKFYVEWVEKIIRNSGKGEKIFVLERNKKPIAYIGSAIWGREIVIELIAVDPVSRGKGMGKKILREFIYHYQKAAYYRFRVVTQGRNIAAQRLYQSCGFEINDMGIDYHKWF